MSYIIDLNGPDGNAYFIIGTVKKVAEDKGLDWKEIVTRLTSGDYQNILNIVEEEFGDDIILCR